MLTLEDVLELHAKWRRDHHTLLYEHRERLARESRQPGEPPRKYLAALPIRYSHPDIEASAATGREILLTPRIPPSASTDPWWTWLCCVAKMCPEMPREIRQLIHQLYSALFQYCPYETCGALHYERLKIDPHLRRSPLLKRITWQRHIAAYHNGHENDATRDCAHVAAVHQVFTETGYDTFLPELKDESTECLVAMVCAECGRVFDVHSDWY